MQIDNPAKNKTGKDKYPNLVRFAHNWNNGTMEYWNLGIIGVPSG